MKRERSSPLRHVKGETSSPPRHVKGERPFEMIIGEFYLARLEQDDERDPPFCIFKCLEKGEQADPSLLLQGDNNMYPGAYVLMYLPVKWEKWETSTWRPVIQRKDIHANPFYFEDNMESDVMEWKRVGQTHLSKRCVKNINYYRERWAHPELDQPRPGLHQPRPEPLALDPPQVPVTHKVSINHSWRQWLGSVDGQASLSTFARKVPEARLPSAPRPVPPVSPEPLALESPQVPQSPKWRHVCYTCDEEFRCIPRIPVKLGDDPPNRNVYGCRCLMHNQYGQGMAAAFFCSSKCFWKFNGTNRCY